ncbi:MAG TPA: hypothetical protein VNP92_15005 [Actinophytocola sp.]|nr:hypothetical protein [Actinophytocola sp.]
MHAERVVVLGAAGLGALSVFLPWVSVPLLGSITGTELDDGRGWAVLVAAAAALTSAVAGGGLNGELGALARFVGVFAGLAIAGVTGWLLVELYVDGVGSVVGAGLYVGVVAGLAVTFGPDIVRRRTRRPAFGLWEPPRNT